MLEKTAMLASSKEDGRGNMENVRSGTACVVLVFVYAVFSDKHSY